MTKSQLAMAAGISLRLLVYYESGRVTPPRDRLEQIAKLLGYPEAFFFRPEVEVLDSAGVSFRSLARMKASQRDRALAAAEMALELTGWLEARFSLPTPDVPDFSSLSTPEGAAMALRSMWGLGDKPIPHVVRLLEAKGVRVFSLAEEHDSLDGFSFWRDERPFVFLNTMKSAERSRFDASHELAHLVLHRHGSPTGRDVEHEAQAFASAFLVPRTSLTAFAARLSTLDRMIEAKRSWGVSVAAFAHRLHAIGMISAWQYRALCVQIAQRGYRSVEPNSATREMSAVYEKIFAALKEEGLSKQSVARELAWPSAELNSLVFGLVLSARQGGSSGVTSKQTPSARATLSLVP